MKVLNSLGKWISFKLDNFAKLFITKSDLLDISLEEQEDNINQMVEALTQLKTARKNLQDARKENDNRVKTIQANINQYVKKGKEDNARIEIKAKLEIAKQNEALDGSITNMLEKETIMKNKIEMLRQIHVIQEGKVAYYKTVSSATSAQLKSVDVNTSDLDMNKIMNEMGQEIKNMDNRMSSLDEMEKDGTIKREGFAGTTDAEVDEELDRIKASIKK